MTIRITKRLSSLVFALMLVACTPSTSQKSLDGLAAINARTPHLARSPNGIVLLSYVSGVEGEAALRYVTLEGNKWSKSNTVAMGSDWFINWADFPSVVPLDEERWAAHWLVKKEAGSFAYDAVAAISNDGGGHWSQPIALHDDNTLTEHGFVSFYAATDHRVGALWLDGRELAAPVRSSSAATQLRGAVLSERGIESDQGTIDPFVCDCCQTDLAMAVSGPVVAYRNRTSEEVRDIFVSRWLDGQWQAGHEVARDGWVINGCPVNGPAIDARGDAVAVAWFSDHPTAHTSVAFSRDGAKTFTSAIEVAAGNTIGRVDVAMINDDRAVISWLERDPELLVARVVERNGRLGPRMNIADVDDGRNAGFPQMIYLEDRLLFAWTAAHGNTTAVRTLAFEL